ncbi:uncharacterized protein J7T54_007728 [Emericellopsis cladophorae]|uniref:Protein SQS1 n=1 Tax=Emericellopsis cladophorae TaxID=2686198 RepID=A0A9P9XYI8_9HYPO|nr:uncharacterized protein J7T54_007728 [Emericellopsis cladophorae]KAI6779684.1 hypothetical protein J7T54_007728 [Emericellopsis cladophorae]
MRPEIRAKVIGTVRPAYVPGQSFFPTTLDENLTVALPPGPPTHSEDAINKRGEDAADDRGENAADDSGEEAIVGPEEMERDLDDGRKLDQPEVFFFDVSRTHKRGHQSASDVRGDSTEKAASVSDESEGRSTDEIILFKGRETSTKTSQEISATPSIMLDPMYTEIMAVESDIHPPRGSNRGRQSVSHEANRGRDQPFRERSDEDSLLADYIANLRENGEITTLLGSDFRNVRDIGGPDFHAIDTSGNPASSVTPTTQLKTQNGDEQSSEVESEAALDDDALAQLLAGQHSDDALLADPANSSSTESDSDDGSCKKQQLIDSFDVMDWERPSLRRKKGKGARARINFDLSDSDLEETLQLAFKRDRLKKAERKRQREELRALGMLGPSGHKQDDLRVKYPSGMSIDQMAEEFRGFLLRGDSSLSLPPMDNNARKIVHELASKFNIKSKSTGKASQRRPTLYRTNRTLEFSEPAFNKAVGRITRRYLPRLDTRGKRAKQPAASGASNAAASYYEGEVIGAAAPELGVENRGRAMLEKMGWSTGTALGTLENKGILQPVSQTMKKSKAGLG